MLKNRITILFPVKALLISILYWPFICSCVNDSNKLNDALNLAIKNTGDADEMQKESAIAVMDSLYYTVAQPGLINKADRHNVKCDFYLRIKKDYVRALRHSDSLLQICEAKLGDPLFDERRVPALHIRGKIYFAMKNYDEALQYFVLSKRAGEEFLRGDCSYLGYSGIPNLLYMQGKYRAAATQFLDNLRTEQRCQKDPWLKFVSTQGNLNSAGMSYDKAGLLDSARYYYDSAYRFISTEGKNFADHQPYIRLAKAVVNQGRASIMEKTGKKAEAEALYLASIDGTRAEYPEFTLHTKIKLARMLLGKNDLLQSAALLKDLEKGLQLDDLARQEMLALQADYYQQTNNHRLAYTYLQKAATLKDTLEAQSKRLAAMDVNYEFRVKEQELINDLLVRENKAKSFQLAMAILLGLMAIIIIAFVWYYLRKSAWHVRALRNLNGLVVQQNEELQKAFKSLEQSQAENTRITRMVAHDLKNPISGIKILASGMAKKEIPEEFREYLDHIKIACATSLTVINDMLTDLPSSEMTRESVDMKRLLQNCVELLKSKAGEKHQQLLMQADEATVEVNRQRIWRVISNLITNAIKFSPSHSKITVRLENKKQSLLFSVEDHGIGIPDQLKDKIFYHPPLASRKGTDGEESYGLGLSISTKIVEEHGGKIWFESKENEGSTFYVELPYHS